VLLRFARNDFEKPSHARMCLDVDTMGRIVDVHFPNIKKRMVEEALRIFFEVREVPGLKKKPSISGTAGLAQAALERGHDAGNAQGARPAKADPATARRAIEERAGRALVRAAGVFEPKGSVTSFSQPTKSSRWFKTEAAHAARAKSDCLRLLRTGSSFNALTAASARTARAAG
jgi:hypothetical protein